MAAQLVDGPELPADAAPEMAPIHLDARAGLALLRGRLDRARIVASRIGQLDLVQAYSPLSFGFASYVVGLSHLWEG